MPTVHYIIYLFHTLKTQSHKGWRWISKEWIVIDKQATWREIPCLSHLWQTGVRICTTAGNCNAFANNLSGLPNGCLLQLMELRNIHSRSGIVYHVGGKENTLKCQYICPNSWVCIERNVKRALDLHVSLVPANALLSVLCQVSQSRASEIGMGQIWSVHQVCHFCFSPLRPMCLNANSLSIGTIPSGPICT